MVAAAVRRSPATRSRRCIVIWGYNIPASCPDNVFGHWIIDLMKKGTKIICHRPAAVLVRLPGGEMAAAQAGHRRRPGHGLPERHHRAKALRPSFRREMDERPSPDPERHRETACGQPTSSPAGRRTTSSSGIRFERRSRRLGFRQRRVQDARRGAGAGGRVDQCAAP